MDVKLEYRIGNRRVSKRRWARHFFEDAPRKLAQDAIDARVGTMRCPQHHRAPSVERQSSEFRISGCCDEFASQVAEALR